jgi:hypothetical protein
VLPAIPMALLLAACAPGAGPQGTTKPNRAGLVTLPCDTPTLKAFSSYYCATGRNYVTPQARALLVEIAARFVREHPGSVVLYMDASGSSGKRPFWPHLSHGDGREIDVALFYQNRSGKPLPKPPGANGYWNYEPPRPGDPVMCLGVKAPFRDPDPRPDRAWRLDEALTRDLVRDVIADARVRRVFLEPHLKQRLGFSAAAKIHFQGCQAARHDDHLHIDVL